MTNILICGIGGQGTVLAAKLLDQAAIASGLPVHSAETIGMAQRGGSVTSHVRIGKECFSPLIPFGTADMIISFEMCEAVRNLEYLKKGGRISSTVAFAGELISLKPVIGVVGGEVKMVGKAIGSRRGNNLLNRLVESKGGIDFTMPYGTIWSGLDDSMLQKYINDSASLWEGHTDKIPSYILGGTIGTHIGPGAIGVAFFEK